MNDKQSTERELYEAMPKDLDDAIKQLFLDGIIWGRKNPYGTIVPMPSDVSGIKTVRRSILTHLEAAKREAEQEATQRLLDNLEKVVKASRKTVYKETIEMFIFDARRLSPNKQGESNE